MPLTSYFSGGIKGLSALDSGGVNWALATAILVHDNKPKNSNDGVFLQNHIINLIVLFKLDPCSTSTTVLISIGLTPTWYYYTYLFRILPFISDTRKIIIRASKEYVRK